MDSDLFDFESLSASDSSSPRTPEMFPAYPDATANGADAHHAPFDHQKSNPDPFQSHPDAFQPSSFDHHHQLQHQPTSQWAAPSPSPRLSAFESPAPVGYELNRELAQAAAAAEAAGAPPQHWSSSYRHDILPDNTHQHVAHRMSVSGPFYHDQSQSQNQPHLFRRATYSGDPSGLFSDVRVSSSHSSSSVSSLSDYHNSPRASPFEAADPFLYTSEPASLDPLSLHSHHSRPNSAAGASPSRSSYMFDNNSDYSVPSDQNALYKDGSGSPPLIVPTQRPSTASSTSSASPSFIAANIYRPSSSGSGASHINGVPVMHTDDAASKETQFLRRRCFNCHTTEPPSWRRSTLNAGKIVCNKCGLYERTHSKPRPQRFDEMRPGNAKVRKAAKALASGSLGGTPPTSPPVKVMRGITKKDHSQRGMTGMISRRSSFSSNTSGASDYDDSNLLYPRHTPSYDLNAGSSFNMYPAAGASYQSSPQSDHDMINNSPIRIPRPPVMPSMTLPQGTSASFDPRVRRKSTTSPLPYPPPSSSFFDQSSNQGQHAFSPYQPSNLGMNRPAAPSDDYVSRRTSFSSLHTPDLQQPQQNSSGGGGDTMFGTWQLDPFAPREGQQLPPL